jgi:hypothetical protein
MLKKLLLVASLLAIASASEAAVVATGIGPRVGFSVDPDQIVFGGHAVIGEIAPSVTFDPSLEFGFGDNSTVVAMNFDAHYHATLANSDWRPYFGAGIGVNFFSHDNPAPFRDDSDTNVGGNLILGAGIPTRSGNRFFTELRLGLGDIPSLKMIAGWNFRL